MFTNLTRTLFRLNSDFQVQEVDAFLTKERYCQCKPFPMQMLFQLNSDFLVKEADAF